MKDEKRMTLIEALGWTEAGEVKHSSQIYLALAAQVDREPARFNAEKRGKGNRNVVDLSAVMAWYADYKPRQARARAGSIRLYLREVAYKERLEELARRAGRDSISAAVNDLAEGSLLLVESEE